MNSAMLTVSIAFQRSTRMWIICSAIILSGCGRPQADIELKANSSAGVGYETTLNAWVSFWNTYDLRQLDTLFTDSASYFSSEKTGLIMGKEALRKHHQGFGFVSGGKQPSKSLWLENSQATPFHDNVLISSTWYFGDRQLPNDSAQQGPVTFLFVRNGNSFKIQHAHFANNPRKN